MGKLAKMSIAELQEELGRKQEHLQSLLTKRDELRNSLAGVEDEISELVGEGVEVPAEKASPAPKPSKGKAKKAAAKKGGAKKGGGRKGRSGRKPATAMAIREVMQEAGRPMRAGEVADALRERKFRTKSKDLDNLVRNAIPNVPGVKKVKRGFYQVAE